MTKEELKKEAQEQANYHTPLYIEDFIYGYLAGAEPREKQISELEAQVENIRYYLDNEIPHKFINEATTKIWRMLK